MTCREVLFNMLAAKKVKTIQVPIMRIENDKEWILYANEDALVIKANIANKEFNQILVDIGSSMDRLFKSMLEEMGTTDLRLEYINTSLKGFGRGTLTPIGIIELLVTIGSRSFEKNMMLDFIIVEESSFYYTIFWAAIYENQLVCRVYPVSGT